LSEIQKNLLTEIDADAVFFVSWLG